MKTITVITVVAGIATIVGTGLGIFLTVRYQVFQPQPALTFSAGVLYANGSPIPAPIKKNIKKATVSTLIYGANIPQNSEVVFICNYLLMNNSELPIYNITLQLEYLSKYAVEKEILIRDGIDREVGLRYRVEYYESRQVLILDSVVHIRYTIPILRAGEKIIIGDTMKFTNVNRYDESKNGNYVISNKLAERLREIKKLCDFCIIDAFVYSESCSPIAKRIKLLWFDTNSREELESLVANTVKVFWGGKLPEPGFYWVFPPWKKLMINEYGEVIIPKLKVVKTQKDRYFCWENPFQSRRTIATLKIPPWNYYQVPDNPVDTHDMIRKHGFIRISWHTLVESLVKNLPFLTKPQKSSPAPWPWS